MCKETAQKAELTQACLTQPYASRHACIPMYVKEPKSFPCSLFLIILIRMIYGARIRAALCLREREKKKRESDRDKRERDKRNDTRDMFLSYMFV